jgi:bifunctional non-homologous end joining protein LigD
MLVAFDALAVAGADVRALRWLERRGQLDSCSPVGGVLRVTPVLHATVAVHDALFADGWEGIVAKQTTSSYSCGRRTNAWLKLKSPAAIERDRLRVASALRPAA